jgi:tripartite-type tricarboxylate transporter receptor subunit TctC
MRISFALALFLAAFAAAAQQYPSKPIRIIVPYPAGGPTDIVARLLAQRLSERWSVPVLIDNRGGAAGIIGTELGAKAAPDGHTLLWGTSGTHAINPSLYRDLPYDALRDFAPITLVALGTNALVVHPSIPAHSPAQLIALARAKPNQLNFGSSGSGATSHLAGEMLKTLGKVQIVHVPFKGAAPAIVALVAGQVDLAVLDLPPLLPQIRAGKLRALGVAARNRFPGLPQVPTLIEAGLPGFDASSWHGLWAPAATPKAIVDKLNAEVAAIVRTASVVEQLTAQGSAPVGNSPEQFARFIRDEMEKWGAVVRQSGAKVD